MKTISPKVKELLDQIALMDARELKEFRVRLTDYLGIDLGSDGDEGTPVIVGPKQPVLTGEAKKFIDSL